MIHLLRRCVPVAALLVYGGGFARVIAADHGQGHLLAQSSTPASVSSGAQLQLVLAAPLPKQVKPEIASMVKELVKAP